MITSEVSCMALVGYARVSSSGQSLDVQLDKLKSCDKVYKETQSGTNQQRSQLAACLEYIRDGDTLIVSRLDRLARSTLHLCTIADTLQRKNVALQVIDQNIDTSSATGRLLFNMLAAIAEFETELRSERQLDGINKAKELGVKFGRSRRLSPQQVIELQLQRQQGVLVKVLMKDFALSKASVYRYLGTSSPEVP